MVEDINEKVSYMVFFLGSIADNQHVEAWSAMLDANEPPIAHSQITPYLGEHAFKSKSLWSQSSLFRLSRSKVTDRRTRDISRWLQSEKDLGFQAL
jgi:hypothetical protein